MIYLENVSLTVGKGQTRHTVLSDANVTLPSDRKLVIYGRDVTALLALANLLTGTLTPQSGRVVRTKRVSYIIGATSWVRPQLTVRQNIRHICEIYNLAAQPLIDYVNTVSGLGDGLNLTYAQLPGEWRVRFIYSLGYGMPFEVYVFHGIIAAGDMAFRRTCIELFEQRARTAGTILTSNEPRRAAAYGDCAAILHGGRLFLYDDMQPAVDDFNSLPKNSLDNLPLAALVPVAEEPPEDTDQI
jgi:capsular polysaccharide transport system ATP-binding protein